jgi:peptide/nickel transport system permease protein
VQAFIVRRFLLSVAAVLGVTFVVFAFSSLLGDPRNIFLESAGAAGGYGVSREVWDELGRKLHLDRPVVVRYAYWLRDLVKADLGRDLQDGQSIAKKIRQKAPVTARLAVAAWILATLLGVPIGVISAVKRGGIADYLVRGFALLGQSLPAFWIGLMGIFIFAVRLHWLPVSTPGEGLAIRNFILPAATLGWLASAGYARLTRSAMLEVLDSEYIKMARAKGVREWVVIWKHAFRNALIPPMTYSGLLFVGFLEGSIVVEVIFSWPGLARLAAEAVWTNNFPVLVVVVVLFSTIAITMNFLVDVAYAYADPRIRYR